MHESVESFVEHVVAAYDLRAKHVLDVGSYDVNGSNRHHFTNGYVGVDMRDGPNVDQVVHSWDLPFEDESFDVVVTTEMLEHDEHPERTFPQLERVLRPDGYLIVTARAPGYPLHDYPGDYHRYTPNDLRDWFLWLGLEPLRIHEDDQAPGTFGVAHKPDPPFGPTGLPHPVLRGI